MKNSRFNKLKIDKSDQEDPTKASRLDLYSMLVEQMQQPGLK